jgi:hypothetical protein
VTLTDRYNALGGVMSEHAIVAAGGPPWLTDALVCTAAARERLLRYARAGFPPADRRRLQMVNVEHGTNAVLLEVFGRVPGCVAEHATRNVIVAPVGKRASGWISTLPTLPRRNERPFLISIAADRPNEEVASTFAHELAHAWLSYDIEASEPLDEPAANEDNPASMSTQEFIVEYARDEWQVATLARSWGFTGSGADVDSRAATLRQYRAEMEKRA